MRCKENLFRTQRKRRVWFTYDEKCNSFLVKQYVVLRYDFAYVIWFILNLCVDVSDGPFIWTAKWAWAGKWLNGSRHNPHFQQMMGCSYEPQNGHGQENDYMDPAIILIFNNNKNQCIWAESPPTPNEDLASSWTDQDLGLGQARKYFLIWMHIPVWAR